MTSEHTPGPWESIGNIVRVVPLPTERGGMSGGYLVAETAVQDIHRYANARLISAAPDLFEAAQAFETAVEADGLPPGWGLLNDMMRAAIAKARGED